MAKRPAKPAAPADDTTQITDQKPEAAPAASGPAAPAMGNEGPAAPAEGVQTSSAEPAAQKDPVVKSGPYGWEVVVTGPTKGRWRIGRKFGPEPVAIPAHELTEAQIERLSADPELTVAPRQIEA